MAKRRKVNEEEELNELLTFNSDDEIKKIKKEINNYSNGNRNGNGKR